MCPFPTTPLLQNRRHYGLDAAVDVLFLCTEDPYCVLYMALLIS
jgi:hypothetical protein